MDNKNLRKTLGLFSTGVMVGCARKDNFLSNQKFISEKFLTETLSAIEKHLPKNLVNSIKSKFSDHFFGITINSFTSVSLDPALISFCIDNRSANLELFKKNRYFSLNILSQQQQDLADAFASPKNTKKWDLEPYYSGKYGSPIFSNSLAFFECKKHRVIKIGDHHMILGEILDFDKINENEPLIFFSGSYK